MGTVVWFFDLHGLNGAHLVQWLFAHEGISRDVNMCQLLPYSRSGRLANFVRLAECLADLI